MSSLMLVCAVVASLAIGVLVAQGLCVLMFEVFRIRASQADAVRESERRAANRLGSLQS